MSAGFFHVLGDLADLLSGFDGAGSCDDLKISAPDFSAGNVYDRVLRVELAVHIFIRFLDSLYGFHNIEGVDEIDVYGGSITDQSKNGGIFSLTEVNVQVHALEPGD